MLKQTALNATHKQLGAKMVPFGGWDMPVWYASTREEHLAVRNSAGLFDVSHMGVLDVRGANACAFLDRVGTNDVSKLSVGKSHYSYLLDDNGDVIDDIMIYRVEEMRYLVVVNASNMDKNWAWLQQQNIGDVKCDLRDLRDSSSGADMRVDLAVQGPKSLDILASLLDERQTSTNDQSSPIVQLSSLAWAGITRATLGGHDVFISRTGYTGERIAYEIFVHPDECVALWNSLIVAGAKPCGLASRDSLRTEAGLPLYGHELGGELNLAPFHIGFDNFVKTSKGSDFIGKAAYLQKASQNKNTLARFRMNEKSVRPSKLGDPVIDKRGRVIGAVTSCAQDTEGFLVGMALIEGGANEGVTIYIVSLPDKLPDPLKPFAPLGSRTLVPDAATVISRFPPKKNQT